MLTEFQNSPLTVFTRDIQHQKIQFEVPDSSSKVQADLYLPSGSSLQPAIVFFMGIVPPNREEERIVRLAEGLARSGMVVMIPWLETQKTNQLSREDIGSLVASFKYLETHPRVRPDAIGMGGICTGASMSVIAAQDPRINEKVKFVNSFAGYYDAIELIVSTSSNTQRVDQHVQPWNSDNLTSNMITNHLINGLAPEDKTRIKEIINSDLGSKPTGQVLSKNAHAVFQLVSGSTRKEAIKYTSDLNQETQSFLASMSPSTNIKDLKAHLLLMHDTHDRLIPSGESRRFAKDVEQNGGSVYHTEFSLFQKAVKVHTTKEDNTENTFFLGEAWKLFLHMYNVMKLAR